MSQEVQGYQRRIAELDAENQALQQQLQNHQRQQQLQQQQQSRSSLAAIALESLPGGVFWKDVNSYYLGCNQYFAQLANLNSPQDIIGKSDYELPWTQVESDWYRECDRRVIQSGEPELQILESQYQADGQVHWVETNKIPLRGAYGQVVGILGTFIDVSERVKYQEQLEEKITQLDVTESRFRRLADNLPGVVFQFCSTIQGNREFTYVSEGSREIYDLEADEFIQMFERIHPDDVQTFEIMLQESARSLTRLQHEHRIVLPDQSIKWVNVIAQPEQQDEQTILWDGLIIEVSDRKNTESQLRQSEERFRGLVETLNDWIWECDHQGILTYSSPQVEQILGYSPAELIGKTAFELMPPEEAARLQPVFEQKLANQEPLEQVENIHLHQQGYPVVLETSAAPILDDERNLLGYRGIDRDISQRKQSEEHLRQKEIQYRQVFETITDGLGIINLNTSNLMEANPAYSQMHGYSHEEFMAIPLAQHVHPDSIPILNQFVTEIQAGRPFTCTAQNIHRDGHTIDIEVTGTPYPYQGEIHALTLIRNVTQQVKLEAERRCQENALRESSELIYQQVRREKLLNKLTNQIRNSLNLQQIIDTTVREIQNFLGIDRCHFAWYVRDAKVAYWDVISEVQSPDLPSFVGQHHAANFGALSELLLRQQIIRLDDSTTVADPAVQETLTALGNKSMMVLPVCAQSGRFGIIACIHCQTIRPWQNDEVELLAAVVDQLVIALNQSDLLAQSQARATELEALLTQLKQAQLQLVQSEKMSSLGQLVAGVAHEINNPVNFIHGNIDHAKNYTTDLMGLLDLYQEHYPQPHEDIQAEIEDIDLDFLKGDVTDLFQSMQVGTNRIREIVQSLRTFSRLDESEIKEVDLHEGIDSTLTILKTRLRDQKWRTAIQIIKHYGDLPLIECYAGQLNQVFMNILSNAIDALDEQDRDRSLEQQESHPSTIQIQTQVIDQMLQIQITDNGPGIPPEVQARLFDPFFTTKAVGKGTGLGLSISYQVVTEKHQGNLTCISQPGETTFCIEIPLQRTDKSALA